MAIVTLLEAQAHCKADGDDNELLQKYIDAAAVIAEDYCNRRFFENEAAMLLAQKDTIANTRAAYDTYYDALEKAEDAEEDTTPAAYATGRRLRTAAQKALTDALLKVERVQVGVVATPAVVTAMLMIVGKLYVEREDYMVTPQGARDLLDRYLWIGGPQP